MASTPSIYRMILQVSDLPASTRFYERLLGIRGRSITGAGRTYFDCGPVILALVDHSGEGASHNPDFVYFSVSGLEAYWERASGLGCLDPRAVHGKGGAEIAVRPWGERSFYARDPDGSGLCFVDSTTLFRGEGAP